ncbi:MAG: hypothetical protein Q8K82_04440 [Gemmatimonadaceae bacterium]|nr:hypothetical protein [Gemmatimonadaceae bacterium]
MSEPMTVAELVHALRSYRLRMLIAGGVTFALVILFILLVPPRYRSEALLRVETRAPDMGLLGSLPELEGMSSLGLGRDEVETEIGVLASRRMQDAAIDSLGLEVTVTQPRSGSAGVIVARAHGESLLDGEITLKRGAADTWAVKGEWENDAVSLPATISTGKPLRVGTLEVTVVAPDSVSTIELRLRPRYRVHERLDDRLVVRRRSPGAKLIEVRFEDRDRQLTAQVVEVVVGTYLDYARHLDRGDAGKTIIELRHATDSVARELRLADERLRDYQSQAKIIAPEEQAAQQVLRVAKLRAQLDQVELERDALAKLLALVDTRSSNGRDAKAFRQLATFPTLISNRAIQDLLASLIALENERAKLGVRRTEENADVRAATDRIEALERDLRRVGSQYEENLGQQFIEYSRTLTRLTADLGALPATEMQYVRFVRERTLLGETWALMKRQLKQAELQDVLRLDKVRLVDAPRVPQPREKVFPRPLVHSALGAVLALLVALATGLVGVLWLGTPLLRKQDAGA